MLRRARERGPALLVPLTWLLVTAAHLDVVGDRPLFVAHLVMAVVLVVFAATGRADMRTGALRVWWTIVAVGVVPTTLGALGFLVESARAPLHGVALFGWMLLPAVGFVDTGRRDVDRPWVYLGGAACCLLGAVLYGGGALGNATSPQLAGLVLVGVGQTAGIVDAVAQTRVSSD